MEPTTHNAVARTRRSTARGSGSLTMERMTRGRAARTLASVTMFALVATYLGPIGEAIATGSRSTPDGLPALVLPQVQFPVFSANRARLPGRSDRHKTGATQGRFQSPALKATSRRAATTAATVRPGTGTTVVRRTPSVAHGGAPPGGPRLTPVEIVRDTFGLPSQPGGQGSGSGPPASTPDPLADAPVVTDVIGALDVSQTASTSATSTQSGSV
ncbi:MAG: hypothetical protein JWM93_3836, partial [Frankiales bacterium]|nr:hypothetical protein [Frankiales bacterium]